MAYIKKVGARSNLAQSIPMPFVREEGDGLKFGFNLVDKDGKHYIISITHVERDRIIRFWNELEKEWEKG